MRDLVNKRWLWQGRAWTALPRKGDLWWDNLNGEWVVSVAGDRGPPGTPGAPGIAGPEGERGPPGGMSVGEIGPVPPSSPLQGEVWFDTSSRQLRMWSGSQWLDTSMAITQVSPSSPSVGSIWFDNEFHVWDGTSWTGLGVSTAAVIATAAPAGQASGTLWSDGYKLYSMGAAEWGAASPPLASPIITSVNSPPSPASGQIWFDQDQLHIFDGLSWIAVRASAGVATGATAPVSPVPGNLWFNGTSLAVRNNSVWVALPAGAAAPAGERWTLRSAVGNYITDMVYNAGKFVAVNFAGNPIISSSDGINWVSGSSYPITAVGYGNGQFVALGVFANSYTSADGVSWTEHVGALSPIGNVRSIAFGAGIYVAVGGTPAATSMLTSSDGINWTVAAHPLTIAPSFVRYVNGLFIIATNAASNQIATSPDGVAWTPGTLPVATTIWTDISYGAGRYVMVGRTGAGGKVMTSTDAATWVQSASALDITAWQAVAYGNGRFVAVSSTGSPNQSMWSTDGLTWTLGLTPRDAFWNKIAFGSGIFLTSESGTNTNNIMTTPG